MERRRFGNADLTVSSIGLGCYGMSGAYGPADDAESIATIRCALDLDVNFLDTSASYGKGHNHRLIGEAIRGRRHDVVIHSKSGSPREGSSDAVRGGGDPRYLRQTCEQSLKNLGIETLDVFCMSRVDPNVPIEESVGGMAELVTEGKTRFISLSECSAESLRRASAVHPLVSLQMEYSLFSRDAEEQGQIDATAPMSRKTSDCARRLRPSRAGRTPHSPSSPSLGRWPRARVLEPSSYRYLARNRARTLRRMCAPRTLCSRRTISRKSTASYRPVPRPALAIR
jgi:aryl-alcohol dehydrogenase-like predicted oxidoreductase